MPHLDLNDRDRHESRPSFHDMHRLLFDDLNCLGMNINSQKFYNL